MRTTLTLDDDLARQLKKRARNDGIQFKELVNNTLRRGLSVGSLKKEKRPRFVVHPISSAYQPGIDRLKFNQMIDEMEIQDFLAHKNSEQKKS